MMLLAKKLTSKWTCFLKSIHEDEDSLFFFFFFYFIFHSVCDELLPYLKQNPKKCLTTNQKKGFKIAILHFWTKRANSFQNVIINQWEQLLPGSLFLKVHHLSYHN